ncbi:uncharacterized protein NFIA_002480 [Aspergillus fischeri NRRL 181]|uniref:MACPF-like domain-containing protein n=1 Tax=Neosartorya fischeri (strain ATCC 1020 / DSM 3700 / CBS 544.65 / FGSC A1164 / JCM 1740 / NRRL 181 / WB 181) TaxID=331117 RepID=A1DJK9_NEOFI|nr:uncharacterized protein NFIA_002480 [Aspergillus fischeri NRRL 181]EAW16898.1 hypothetical protein NFIA_002480 [Aspergillus fischeri NRRL 181]KAG2019070.1 hypothetical protein GB937_005361 [Aspergillus fischeri]
MSQSPQGNPLEISHRTWPKFQITIISKDATPFPSFSGDAIKEGHSDKILLSDIRSHAGISQKLKFTADDTSFVNDGITLAYYMALAGETKVKGGNKEPSSDGTIGVVKVKLLPSSAESKPKAPVEPSKELQEGVKDILAQMGDKNGAQVADVEGLSKRLGKLAASSMNFATVAGSEKASDPEDLTESQWARILANNRALHGYYLNGANGIMRKAPKRAFNLAPRKGDNTTTNPLPPFPPFYVHDEADVEVTETQNAFQTILARQGFSATVVKAAGAVGGSETLGSTGSISRASEEEHSNASKDTVTSTFDNLHISYKFPRAVVELDASCLELTPECIKQAQDTKTPEDVKQFFRDYGNVFAATFTLGGELHSTRSLTTTEKQNLAATKDNVKTAAGFSLSSPYVSGGVSGGWVDSSNKNTADQQLRQSLRLAWHARGGDTILCSNPPQWAATVRNHNYWRIIDQECLVNMHKFIEKIDTGVADHLTSPGQRLRLGDDALASRIRDILRQVFASGGNTSMGRIGNDVRAFFESESFTCEQYNAALDEDEEESKWEEKKSWKELTLEEKCNVGFIAYQLGIIKVH